MRGNWGLSRDDPQNGTADAPDPRAQPGREDIDGLLRLYNSGQLPETEARARQLIDRFPAAAIPVNLLGAVLARRDR